MSASQSCRDIQTSYLRGLSRFSSLPQATSPLGGHSTTWPLVYSSITRALHYIMLLIRSCLLPLVYHWLDPTSFRDSPVLPHSKAGRPHPCGIPLYQLTIGLGVPVTRQASFTVSPSSAVQSASSSSNSGGPEDTQRSSMLCV